MLDDYRRARKLAMKQLQADVAAGRYPESSRTRRHPERRGVPRRDPRRHHRDRYLAHRRHAHPRSSEQLLHELHAAARGDVGVRHEVERPHRLPARGGHPRSRPCLRVLPALLRAGGQQTRLALRYLGQPTISAQVIRVVPMPSDSKAYRVYQEFMRFYSVAPIYGIVLSEEGSYAKLAAFAGRTLDEPWPDDAVHDLRSAFDSFLVAFNKQGGERLGMSSGDAFLVYLKIFGFTQAVSSLPSEVARHVERIWDEFIVARDGGKVADLDPLQRARNRSSVSSSGSWRWRPSSPSASRSSTRRALRRTVGVRSTRRGDSNSSSGSARRS